MKKSALALIAAAPLWAACSDSNVDWNSIAPLEGAVGAEAILEWRNGLDLKAEPKYPITVHWDIDVQLKDVPQPLGAAKDGFILASIDSTMYGGNKFRTRCTVEMAAWGRDEYITLHLDSDDDGIRLSHRGIDSLGPIEIPTGISLSADRFLLITQMLQRLISQAPGFSEEDLEFVAQFDGVGGVFHPDNLARLLGPGVFQQGGTWRESDSRTQVRFAPLKVLANSEAMSHLPTEIDIPGFEQLSEIEFVAEFDRESGAFHSLDSTFSYLFDGLPLSTKKQPSMTVTLHGEIRDSEVSQLEFRERDEILDLNDDFDEAQPILAGIELRILTAYRKMAEDFEGADDFSF
mgnify:CR=1 FL=1